MTEIEQVFDKAEVIPHLERMIRVAENHRMAAFLTDLVHRLADPSHTPSGRWNQSGPWEGSDLGLVPQWIRLSCYDEFRVLQAMSFEQKLAWWGHQQRGLKSNQTRRTLKRNALGTSKKARLLAALHEGEWISAFALKKYSRIRSLQTVAGTVRKLRKEGYTIHQRGGREGEYLLAGQAGPSSIEPRLCQFRLLVRLLRSQPEKRFTDAEITAADIHDRHNAVNTARQAGFPIETHVDIIAGKRHYSFQWGPAVPNPNPVQGIEEEVHAVGNHHDQPGTGGIDAHLVEGSRGPQPPETVPNQQTTTRDGERSVDS